MKNGTIENFFEFECIYYTYRDVESEPENNVSQGYELMKITGVDFLTEDGERIYVDDIDEIQALYDGKGNLSERVEEMINEG